MSALVVVMADGGGGGEGRGKESGTVRLYVCGLPTYLPTYLRGFLYISAANRGFRSYSAAFLLRSFPGEVSRARPPESGILAPSFLSFFFLFFAVQQ